MFTVIFCTYPNSNTAKELATKLVKAKLVACVNIIPGIESIYMWEEKLEHTQEHLLIIKTTKKLYKKVEELIKEHHSYACPEIIAIPIEQGSKEYLAWIMGTVGEKYEN